MNVTAANKPEEAAARLDAAGCQDVLRRAFNAVLVESDVFQVIERDPELWRRFKLTEAAIDRAAKSGPTRDHFERVVGLHIAVIKAAAATLGAIPTSSSRPGDPGKDRPELARFGTPDEMPELGDEVVAAVGFSYGDGRPGDWVAKISQAKREGGQG
jgi:hypothetical protein